jgi:hypothetical protein
MSKPSNDPSIFHEPHLQAQFETFDIDPSEAKASAQLARESTAASHHDAADLTVWDEPGLSSELAGTPRETDVTFARWLRENEARTSWPRSLWLTAVVAAVAGPFGILGAIISQVGATTIAAVVALAVIAPVTEEMTKIAAALWVAEKRPYWFKSVWQIVLCGLAGGALFGLIENLMYLFVYIPHATPELARWRWTVCMGLHMNCSIVASFGVARIWYHTHRTGNRPNLSLGVPWFVLAMVGHGLYNFSVTVAEVFGWLDFAD